MNLIRNQHQDTRYFKKSTNELLSYSDALATVAPGPNDLDHFESNGVLMFRQPGAYQYVAGLAPIPARTVWACEKERFEYQGAIGYYAACKYPDRSNFERLASKYLHGLKIESVAVELSGGLDTSLIIEVLASIGVKIKLFGLESDAYAFRTERHIQRYYKSKISDFVCLPYDDCLPLGNLTEVPAHPHPNATNLT